MEECMNYIKGALIRGVYIILAGLVFSCSKVIDRETLKFEKGKVYSVIPFENYTNTPLAGYRVASMLESTLRAKGFRVIRRVWEFKGIDPDNKEIGKILEKASRESDYVIAGSVNEFRYKVGIDGEPAVSISVYLIDSVSGAVVGGATLSGSGMSYDSLGTLTQKLIDKLL